MLSRMTRLILCFIIAITAFSCKEAYPTYNDPIPKHDSLKIASKFVKETRVINVWTPPTYEQSQDSFPVLYMPDGGIKEDFPHIANTLADLIAANKIPPFILVGIENTERGRDLTGASESEYDKQYCPITDGAKDFRAFITQELMPEIDSKYRATAKKGIIGESLAGLFVMETFFLTPNAFDFYIAFDPSLWWNDHYLTKNAASYLDSLADKNIKLWFAGSSVEDISQYTRSLEQTFQEYAPQQLTWKYSDEPNEEHYTIFRATKEKAIIWTLGGV